MYKVRKGKETWELRNEDHLKAFLREGWELVVDEPAKVEAPSEEVHEENPVPKKRTTRRKKAE